MTISVSYEQLKQAFENFKLKHKEKDFDYYYITYSYMNSFIRFAESKNLSEDIELYKKIKKESAEKIREMGYNFNPKD